jgi:hypothetical protein
MTVTPSPAIACEGALSDAILQSARELVDRAITNGHAYALGEGWSNCGAKNPPLLTLLDMLISAAEPVANAIADNAWDDQLPIPADGAKALAQQLHRMGDTITAAASAPDATGWSLPSCTGKELV